MIMRFRRCAHIDLFQHQADRHAYLFFFLSKTNFQGEAYYKSLGYNSLMEGVIGEAEKAGNGDEVRARIEEFQKQSKLKGLATISFFICLFFYYKLQYVPPIVPSGM